MPLCACVSGVWSECAKRMPDRWNGYVSGSLGKTTSCEEKHMADERVVLPGSERAALKDARILGPVDQNERLIVTVVLKPGVPVAIPARGRFLSHDELMAQHGAPQSAWEIVRRFASAHGLAVVDEHHARRIVHLAGDVGAFSSAFGDNTKPCGVWRQGLPASGRSDHSSLESGGIVMAILGLDNREQAKPHHKVLDTSVASSHSGSTLTPPQAARLYNFPTGVDGSGATIAVIELGGGFSQPDLDTYFGAIGVASPSVTGVSVNAPNNPGIDQKSDREVMLDIEVIGGVAPGAKQLVYFSQGDDSSFFNCVSAAVHATPTPTAMSISWGKAEDQWTGQSVSAFTQAFQDAAALGISVFVASGDDGSSDGTSAPDVDFPAASPSCTACGGTTLVGSGGAISSEVVWNDGPGFSSGGGVSKLINRPSYQSSITIPSPGNRGVPDVSGHASAWSVRVSGSNIVLVGTSAVAPLWAGLTALLVQKLGSRLGFLNPQIYPASVSSVAFRDITQGNNDSHGNLGVYLAGIGWDPCTGLGSPNGVGLANALKPSVPTPHPTAASDAHADAASETDAHTASDTNADAASDAHTASDTDAHTASDTNAHAAPDTHTASDTNTHAAPDTHTASNTNTHAASDTHPRQPREQDHRGKLHSRPMTEWPSYMPPPPVPPSVPLLCSNSGFARTANSIGWQRGRDRRRDGPCRSHGHGGRDRCCSRGGNQQGPGLALDKSLLKRGGQMVLGKNQLVDTLRTVPALVESLRRDPAKLLTSLTKCEQSQAAIRAGAQLVGDILTACTSSAPQQPRPPAPFSAPGCELSGNLSSPRIEPLHTNGESSSVGIIGITSLAVIAGSVALLGTVSIVALNRKTD